MLRSNTAGRRAALVTVLLSLGGCGVHRLTEGEPDFNTSALLPRQAHAEAGGAAGAGDPMPQVDAVISGRTPRHGLFYRVFIGWMDPTSVSPAQDVITTADGKGATPSGLVTLRIPQACAKADGYDTQPLPPKTAASAPDDSSAQTPAAQGQGGKAKAGKSKTDAGAAASQTAVTPPDHSQGYPAIKACFYAMKSLIDDNYREYAITLIHAVNYGHLASDLTVQALTTAGAITGGATAKSVLSAVASGVNGARGYIDEDILYNQSISLVLNQMDADRSRIAAVAISALGDESASNPYTASQAYNALLDYYWSGTFSHALDSLKSQTGAAKAGCKAAALGAQLKSSGPAADGKPAAMTGSAAGAAAAGSSDCKNPAPEAG